MFSQVQYEKLLNINSILINHIYVLERPIIAKRKEVQENKFKNRFSLSQFTPYKDGELFAVNKDTMNFFVEYIY